MKHICAIAITALLLTGCGLFQTKPEIQIRTVKEYVYVGVPKDFYTVLEVPKPLPKVEYLSLTDSEKEYELTMYSNTLLGQLAQYHVLQNKLKQWDAEQSLIYKPAQNKDAQNDRKEPGVQ
jgi:hypothetical protein